jgi:hypothetical protein
MCRQFSPHAVSPAPVFLLALLFFHFKWKLIDKRDGWQDSRQIYFLDNSLLNVPETRKNRRKQIESLSFDTRP